MNPDGASPAIVTDQEALVLVSFAHQLVHAMCAVELDRKLNGFSTTGRVIVAVWSYQTAHHQQNSTTRALFESIIRADPFAELLFFSLKERKGPLSPYRRIMQRSLWLRQRLGSIRISHPDFFYAHDASADHTAQAFMQALQETRNICYGDAPGFLYPGLRPPRQSLTLSLSNLKNMLWQSRMSQVHDWYSATHAYTAVDFNEREKDQALPELTPIPPDLLIQHITQLREVLPAIADFEHIVLAKQRRPSTVLLLSNFSKSRLMSQRNEVLLYQRICNENITPGARILIKKHPGTTQCFMTSLLRSLDNFQVEVFPQHLEDLPIELFTEISTHTLVLSVSSASALFSLMPESKVIHALKQKHICKLFYPTQQNYMLAANNKILIHAKTVRPQTLST